MEYRPRAEAGGFPSRLLLALFWPFFSCLFFNIVLRGFFFDFGRVLEAKMRPKIDFWRGFWDAFWAPSFWSDFVTIFMLFFKSRPSKFVRPRNVLLILTVLGVIAICIQI